MWAHNFILFILLSFEICNNGFFVLFLLSQTIDKQIMNRFILSLFTSCCFIGSSVGAQCRSTVQLRQWQFSRDSLHWQSVTIPHDWAISGPFDKKWDLQNVAITQNGEHKASEKSGRSGALPWIGEGWYRTVVRPDGRYSHYELKFDGAMSEPTVYINGRYVGYWAYGYNAFKIDADELKPDTDNEVMVHLQNKEESSRWYPGAGLYRPVSLECMGSVSLDDWGWTVRTIEADSLQAHIRVSATARHIAPDKRENYGVEFSIIHPEGWIEVAGHAPLDSLLTAQMDVTVHQPQLWSPETPFLYQMRIQLTENGRVVDQLQSKMGIRTLTFSKQKGFQLNGVSRKLQGVCLHHDLGPLGAAVNKSALIRQIETMKAMGADAIRTSHNMPSSWQMEVCDSLGMMVMAESFDMWVYPKCKNGYARFFKKWSDRDITNLVLANRNHPSLIMWSIGNEIPEQWSDEGRKIAAHLQELCHRLDPSRPVTQGMDRAEDALKSGFAQVMDIPGFNYRVYKYGKSITQLDKGFLLGSETASTVSSRGIYKFPIVWSNSQTWPDGQCNGYDTEWCSWSNLPEEDFIAQEDAPYTIGQFVWTGYDYLGEPTPYDNYWPSRSSYFGICDLAGLPKDRYWLYRSVWNKREHTLHLLPHWTWPGREGKVTPVFCYTDYPSAELFVNGQSQGRLYKEKNVKGEWATGHAATPAEAQERAKRYRLMWNDVKYYPGILKVVAYDEFGRAVQEAMVRTAGRPNKLVVEPYFKTLAADGESLQYLTVSLADAQGQLVPMASDQLKVEVSGTATFKGICNGDATSLQVFTQPEMKLFGGQLVIVIQSNGQCGEYRVVVTDKSRPLPSVTFKGTTVN